MLFSLVITYISGGYDIQKCKNKKFQWVDEGMRFVINTICYNTQFN